jgi:hypothetical protein
MKTCDCPICFTKTPTRGLVLLYNYHYTNLNKSLRLHESEAPRISRHSGYEGCQPYAPAAFTPQDISLVLISVSDWVDPRTVVRLEVLYQWVIPLNPSVVEPATLPFVARRFKDLWHRVPQNSVIVSEMEQTRGRNLWSVKKRRINLHLTLKHCLAFFIFLMLLPVFWLED